MEDSARIAVRAAAAANSGDVLLELDDDLLKLPCMSAGQSVLAVVERIRMPRVPWSHRIVN
jgi:hypothetical protein